MRLLVWQWGRRGAGPRYASALAAGLGRVPGVEALLSLSRQAEILAGAAEGPRCDLPVDTYRGWRDLLLRLPLLPFQVAGLARKIAALRPDAAICAMPAPLDLLMAAALRRARVPYAVVVHDADLHPGDVHALQMVLQRRLVARADAVVALSRHVGDRLCAQGLAARGRLILSEHPPLTFGPLPPPPRAHGGRLRLLCFGRLLPYKGLDLLAAAMAALGPRDDLELRVVGSGPESPVLDALRQLPGVQVENRWVPEAEVADILAWADALVLPYREASQSGVAAAALAAGRFVVATRVGGISEQLAGVALARLVAPEAASLATALAALAGETPAATAEADRWPDISAALARDLAVVLG
ncbi:MAG: glycosyltransferase [Acetobacteraceae bacterium]|nr:glycosyltransferase [Acetobacteraceae bacterium]